MRLQAAVCATCVNSACEYRRVILLSSPFFSISRLKTPAFKNSDRTLESCQRGSALSEPSTGAAFSLSSTRSVFRQSSLCFLAAIGAFKLL